MELIQTMQKLVDVAQSIGARFAVAKEKISNKNVVLLCVGHGSSTAKE
jgi:hypothetical protein